MIQEAFASPTRAHAKRQRTFGLVASLAAVSVGLIALGYPWFSYNPEQTSATDYDYYLYQITNHQGFVSGWPPARLHARTPARTPARARCSQMV